MTGTVQGYEVRSNRDSSQQVLMLQVEVYDGVTKYVELMSHAGFMHVPVIGSIVTIFECGTAWKIAVAENDGEDFDDSLAEGEQKVYSSGGAYTSWKSDGSIELNGDADTAVSYADLNAALQTFLTALNSHTHPDPSSGTTGPPSSSMSIDISGAQVPEVKLP